MVRLSRYTPALMAQRILALARHLSNNITLRKTPIVAFAISCTSFYLLSEVLSAQVRGLELLGAFLEAENKVIAITFGKVFPDSDSELEDVANWRLIAGKDNELSVTCAQVLHPRGSKSVELRVDPAVPTDRPIVVTYLRENFPSVSVGNVRATTEGRPFTVAKGRSDSDIYVRGAYEMDNNTDALYSLDAKGGFLFDVGRWGALGAKGTVITSSKKNVDLDSTMTTLSLERVVNLSAGTVFVVDFDFLGTEHAKGHDTTNVVSKHYGKLLLPSLKLPASQFISVGLNGGTELGRGIGRWLWGFSTYYLFLRPPVVERMSIDVEYVVRRLWAVEPYHEPPDVAESHTKPRSFVSVGVNLELRRPLSVSMEYQRGSLPPRYNFVSHKYNLGLTLKLKQSN